MAALFELNEPIDSNSKVQRLKNTQSKPIDDASRTDEKKNTS